MDEPATENDDEDAKNEKREEEEECVFLKWTSHLFFTSLLF